MMSVIKLYKSGFSDGGMFDGFRFDGHYFYKEDEAFEFAKSKHGNYAKVDKVDAIKIGDVLHEVIIRDAIDEGEVR